MFTELNQTKMMETSQQDSNPTAKNQDSSVTFVSKQKEPGMNGNNGETSAIKDQTTLTRKQERDKRIATLGNRFVAGTLMGRAG
jgi:hypothetical protein